MTSDPPPPVHATVSPDAATPAPAATPTNLGTLARKIRGRTTDLVAIGVVLIAGLTFGRQVISWWRADNTPSTTVTPAAATMSPSIWGGDGTPVDLQFGDSPLGLSRQTMMGSVIEAQQKLLALCSEKTRNAALPERPAQPNERKMLDRISNAKPVTQEPGTWEVYLFEQPLPLVLGVRIAPEKVGMQAPGVEEGRRRVVCWGWLFPRDQESFAGYCVQAAGTSRGEQAQAPEMPLPPGSHRLLSVRGTREGELISFSGPGSAEAWKDFFDQWVQKQGVGPMEWQRVGVGWSARLRDLASSREVTWHFAPKNFSASGSGEWLGIIDLIPIREPRGNP